MDQTMSEINDWALLKWHVIIRNSILSFNCVCCVWLYLFFYLMFINNLNFATHNITACINCLGFKILISTQRYLYSQLLFPITAFKSRALFQLKPITNVYREIGHFLSFVYSLVGCHAGSISLPPRWRHFGPTSLPPGWSHLLLTSRV